jgi:predicted ATP-dependent serine protease
MLQIAGDVAATGLRVLYVSAEESVEQVGARAARLFGLHEIQPSRQLARIQYIQKNLLMMHEARLEHILDVVEDLQSALRHDGTGAAAEAGAVWQPVTPTAAAKKAATNVFGQGESATGANHDDDDSSHEATLSPLVLLIVDSIQTVYSREDGMESSAPGSVAQVRQCTNRLLELAKRQQRFREPHQRTAILLIGHVTKSGDLAGPKLLEHMVDVVLYLESEQGLLQHRILRCTKNRFGPTDIGIFDLTAQGLLDVPNPSLLYFQPPETDLNSDYDPSATTASALPSTFVQSAVDGVAFSMVMDGTRAFLVEIQALVVKTSLSQPRRTSNGFDLSRLNVILAVLSKRAHLRLETFDVYVNVVGGARIQDPAADLATAVALASSLLTKSPRLATAFIGELGLQGEIRPVPRLDLRLRDIARLGFRYCVCSDRLSQSQEAKARDAGLEIIRCGHINEALAFGIPASKHRAA